MAERLDPPTPPLDLGERGLQFLRHLPHFVRLYWRLFRDQRVSIWPKMLLVLAALYVVSPIDLVPDLAFPFIGEIDDLVIFLAACRMFIYLCPSEVVAEHVRRIGSG